MLPDRCDFRTHSECSCEPHQCRVQNIGTVSKSNDMTGVFTVPPVDQLIRIAMAGVFVLVVWATFEAHDKSQRTALIDQEITYAR